MPLWSGRYRQGYTLVEPMIPAAKYVVAGRGA